MSGWVGAYAGQVGNDPRAWGAKGDGQTDDTAAVQAALDAGGLVPILLPYRITSTLTIGDDTRLDGQGVGRLLVDAGATFTLLTNADTVGGSSGIELAGLTFDGQNTSGAESNTAHLVNVETVSDFTVRNCRFVGALGDGLGVRGTSTDVEIRDCWFSDGRGNGIALGDAAGGTVTDCTIFGCRIVDHVNGEALLTYGVSDLLIDSCRFRNVWQGITLGQHDTVPRRVAVRGCTLVAITDHHAIAVRQPAGVAIEGCHLSGGVDSGINAGVEGTGLVVRGNTFEGFTGTSPVVFTNSPKSIIADNWFADNAATNSIQVVSTATGSVVQGNQPDGAVAISAADVRYDAA